MVKVNELMSDIAQKLKVISSNPRLEAEVIMSYALKKDKLWLILHKDDEVQPTDAKYINNLADKRTTGMPIAYITGTKEFMSLEFEVNENVLIPRPETEELVSLIIDSCSETDNPEILDLCTGSGAICCSLAYYIKNSHCTGIDIDISAVETAKRNAVNIGVSKRCVFMQGDVLLEPCLHRKFDIVVSNPPYIESKVIASLEKTVKDFEPVIALDGGHDGLMFYKAITKNIEFYLKGNGMVFFEIGYNQGEALKNLMDEKFTDVKVIKDLSGLDRIVCGRLKP